MVSSPPFPRLTQRPVLRPKTPKGDRDARFVEDSRTEIKSLAKEDDSFCDNSNTIPSLEELYARPSKYAATRGNGLIQHRVMTPADFDRYRQDQVHQIQSSLDEDGAENEDEKYYEDDEDVRWRNIELIKQQRRKQVAYMTAYRQTMMRVVGGQLSGIAPGHELSMAMSSSNVESQIQGSSRVAPRRSFSDEEVPLAILAARGLRNKIRYQPRPATGPPVQTYMASTSHHTCPDQYSSMTV
ncbi:hypothetical protein G7054_g14785 [Neopestalotiopsis clavispora]|nr:hypothetical protein G7054_g14785 [Neopestalotiopsis clavispora]